MPYQFPPEVDQLVREYMASGSYASEDELIREALLSLSDVNNDDLAKVKEALRELKSGDPGMELAEAFQEIRKECGIDPGA